MGKTYKVNYLNKKHSHISSKDEYEHLYNESINNPDKFWSAIAERISWYKKWKKVSEIDFTKGKIEWFNDGKLNVSYNCLDRHVEAGYSDDVAIIWEGNSPSESKKITYSELLHQVGKFANSLKSLGVTKGDRVCIYMQMIPELTVAMLACSRIGAVHSVVFGAFSAESLRDRINDSGCKILITQDFGVRGEKECIPMKQNADLAINECPTIEKTIVVKHTKHQIDMHENDLFWDDIVKVSDPVCEPEIMDAEDPLFILYTSGSTGKPKGVLHTTGGYVVYASYTHEVVFDYHPGDIYWCTADIGWITGHTYIVYGPLSNRATTLMFEGVPNFPDWGRFWQVIEKHQVNIFYTAPTALRSLMKEGDDYIKSSDLSSLRLLGSVGEPIKEPEWKWYYKTIGKEKCPIVDTWWQTETGGILISPLPGVTNLKPGSASKPLFGIHPVIFDDNGFEYEEGLCEGYLAIKKSWPGQMRTIFGDHDRFIKTYFSQYEGYYFTGDGVKRDSDGYYWITGRVDDVLNVSGHRLGTAEIEGAIGSHPDVAEAAIVGYKHDIKGHGVYAYVTLMSGIEYLNNIEEEIKIIVRRKIGAHAYPDKIQFTKALPKTRSGKIMRRILRSIANNELDRLGDTSTLADPDIVDIIISERK